MFFWKTSVLLDALRQLLPKTASLLASLAAVRQPQICRAPGRRVSAVRKHFDRLRGAGTRRERGRNCRRATSAGTTSEAGTPSMSCTSATRTAMRCARTSLDRSEHRQLRRRRKKLVALLGVKDLIVVDTPDALLIADRSRAQQVGELVKRLEKAGRARFAVTESRSERSLTRAAPLVADRTRQRSRDRQGAICLRENGVRHSLAGRGSASGPLMEAAPARICVRTDD